MQNKVIKLLIEETESINVKDIYYRDEDQTWVIIYKDGDRPDEFSTFTNVVRFLNNEIE